MKKRIAYILVAVLCIVAAVGLGFGLTRKNTNTGEEAPVENLQKELTEAEAFENAEEYLRTIYKDVKKETPRDFERIGAVPIGKFKFEVTWTVNVSEEYVKIVVGEDGIVTIDVNEACGQEVPYELKATIKDSEGNKKTLIWEHIIPKKISGSYQEIVDKAYALKPGESMENEATLKGKIAKINTPWDAGFKNITVTILVEGRETKPIMCYRLKGDGAQDLALGDIIEVTGTLKNYNGTIEFDAGCILESVVKGDGTAPEMPTIKGTMQEIVDKAYALADNTVLEGGEAILTGSVIKVDDAYSEQYKNITVTIVVDDREDKPIQCYRMKGEKAAEVEVGDLITVRGTLKKYYNADYDSRKVEFDAGCELIKLVKDGATYTEDVPEEITPVPLTDELRTGDKVVIYVPKYGYAFSTTKTGNYNAGVEITMKDKVLSGFGDTETFVVTKNVDGTYSFANGGKNLGLSGSLGLGVANDAWEVISLGEGYYNLKNKETGQFLEWYAKFDNWSVYASSYAATDDQFRLAFHVISRAEQQKATLEQAKATLEAYCANTIDEVTNEDYVVLSKLEIGSSTFNVTWTVDPASAAQISAVPNSAGEYTVDVNEKTKEDINYVLKATITDMDDPTKSVEATFNHTVEAVKEEVPTNEVPAYRSKLYVQQANKNNKIYYFDGRVNSSGYLLTTENKDLAVDVYKQNVEGGYRFYYYLNGNTKIYIEIAKNSSGQVRHQLVKVPTMVYTYSTDANTYVANVDGKEYYTGTYGTYTTLSASETWRITGENASAVGTSQFVVQFDSTPIAYKFYLNQVNLGKTLYFAGAMSGFYYATTENVTEAPDVYIEEVTGGVRFYFMDNGTKTYIEIVPRSTDKANVTLATTPTMVYTYDETANTYVANVNNKIWYLGTYNNFNTFSASETYRITGDNAANVGVSQFVALFAESGVTKTTTNEKPANKFVMSMYQATLEKTLYFAGSMDGYYYATTENKDLAVNVYTENTTGGVYLYYLNGNTKLYFNVYQSGTYTNVKFTTTPSTIFTYNAELETYVTELSGTTYYLGAYGDKTDIRPSNISYVTGNNADNVGKTQYIAKLTPIAYKYYINQVKTGKTLYFAGGLSGFYLTYTEEIEDAKNVYIEEATGGVRFYYMDGTTKTYLELVRSGNYANWSLVTTPTNMVFKYSDEANTYVAELGDKTYYVGTYGTNNRFGTSQISYITGDNAANVGISQFVAYFVEAE